jgi:GrpB-like predicted nucleotidyltransferase (UPF0157 family)
MTSIEPIEIHPYSPQWPQESEEIGKKMRNALGEVALRIDHIGSTSIPDLAAKPIIDIQISVGSLEPMEPFLIPLEALGYYWRRGEKYEKTKRYFRETQGMRRTHVHVRKLGSWHQQFPLLFRDYLRVSQQDCEKYVLVKRELAQRYRYEREKYTDSKSAIFWEIIARADQWAANTGWEPGPSDA